VSLGQIDLTTLPRSEQMQLAQMLTPRMTKYIIHKPYPKQAAFMLLDCKEAFYGGAAGGGKALALDTPIFTDSGWKTIGTLSLKDKVLAIDGSWTELEYITETQHDHKCYELEFNTGEKIIADAQHLWVIEKFMHRKYWKSFVVTTEQLLEESKVKLPKRGVFQGDVQQLPIHPYVFGYWLGDGNAKANMITTADEEVLEYFAQLGYVCTPVPSMKLCYFIQDTWGLFKALGVLRDKYKNRQTQSEVKYIPDIYMRASFEQRLELLRGIMDADGSCQERGRCELGLKERRLADDVATLLASLGITYSRTTASTSYKGKQLESHRFTFTTDLRVFHLKRKYERQKASLDNRILIRNIRDVPSVPVKCIRIKHPSHTFLVGKTLIPTHNSDALLMCALQYVDVPGYAAIIFRRSYADLVKPGALIDRALTWLAPWIASKEVRWVEKEKKFEFPSGAILQFGYMETANDRFNYQGGEYQFVGFDEVTHILEVCYTYMFSRLRRLRGFNVPLRVRAASNPPDDGDNAEWVYNRFVNPETKKPHVVFIPAGMDDNPFLDRESYEESLEELDPVTRARLRDGIWTIVRKGNMFKREWFEFVDAVPPGRRRIRFWDCASTEVEPQKKKRGKDPDWTVGFLMSEKGGIYYIEDIEHVQYSSMQVEELQRRTAQSDGHWTRIREEKEPGSSGDYTIEKKKKEIFKGYAYEGVRSTGSKIQRAMPASAAAERRVIKIVRGCRNVDKFFNELEGFPGVPHDDIVDAFSGAFNELSSLPIIAMPTDVSDGSRETSYWEDASYVGVSEGSSYWII